MRWQYADRRARLHERRHAPGFIRRSHDECANDCSEHRTDGCCYERNQCGNSRFIERVRGGTDTRGGIRARVDGVRRVRSGHDGKRAED